MKTFAKITRDSLKTYIGTVQRVVDYSSTVTAAMSDFDNLICSIGVEIEKLEEKKGHLIEAESVIEEKIAECETKIEETKSYISDKEKDLDNTRSKLENTSETFTLYLNGDFHDIPNPNYSVLEIKLTEIEGLLAKAHVELNSWENRLSRCHAVERELTSILSSVVSRISELNNNKIHVETNKNEFSSAFASINNHSSRAVSKLSIAERSLNDYIGIRLKVIPAFEAVKSEGSTRNLNDLAFLSSKFKNASSKSNKSTMRNIDDEGRVFRNSEGLVPNSTFKLNNYTFTTDSLGRPVSAAGKLKLVKDKPRNWDATLNDMGQGDERAGDDRGHMIGHRFDGPDSIINAIPQDSRINQGEYKDFEDFLATELDSGKEVFVSISPIYHSDSRRPTGVAISYTIDGVRDMRFFNNEIKEGE